MLAQRDSGHFLVVKRYDDDTDCFIVYDPNSWEEDRYIDGSFMGKNRYYKSSEVIDACANWWPYKIEIGEVSDSSSRKISENKIPIGKAGPRL